MEIETCPARVWNSTGWGSHVCGRKIKAEGLCGIHHRQKTEADRKNREMLEKWATDEVDRADLQKRIDKLGLSKDAVISNLGQKRVNISIEELERIVSNK